MRYKVTALCFFLTTFISAEVLAQTVIINDDFSDGDFTNNPTWTDSESKHIINASNLLQLDAPGETAEAVISTPSTAAYGEWEAYIKLGFNPSSSNLARFYIIADNQNMKGSIDGYFVQIGDTEDEISLYRQDGNNTTKIIDGADGLVDTDPVTVRIRVTRDLDGNWELFADPAGDTSYNSQGMASDNTYIQSEFIGLFGDYTSTRSNLFEYDDIQVTKVNPPLDIQNVSVVDNQTIEVSFNLDVDPASVQTSDFTITPNIGNPDNTATSGDIVQLTYNNPISGGQYTLNVSDIADNEGNTIDPNTDFGFQFFDSYVQGDIIINEFAYDYPTTINEEYIEIRNTSNRYLNLANWQIADINSSSSLGSDPIPIEPDSFLVISADTTELNNLFGNRAYHEADFPALNNTTPDAVQLITDTGAKADSLSYNSNWGGTDVALERRSASAPSIYKENWGDSPNPDGGTPGMVNEVAEDNTPPKFTGLNILSPETLQLVFDERLDKPGSYEITNGSITSVDQTAADTVEISLGSDLQNAQDYTLSVENTSDIFGNTIASTDTSFTFYDPSPVDSGDIAINEFMYAPPANSSEYIELYNHSDKSLDLQGWTLSDNRETFKGTISNNQFIIPPDSFVVIAPDNTIESEYPNIVLLTMGDFPALNNGGDRIIIRDQNGILLDSLQYTSDWGGDEVALERRTTEVAGIFHENWSNAPNKFGTPGSQNDVPQDQTPPTFKNLISVDNNKIELTFSEKLAPSSATDEQNYRLSPSIGIQLISAQDETVTLFLEQALTDGQIYEVTVSNISDIFGNTLINATRDLEYLQIDEAQSGQIVINEILYNPGSEGKADFIELYNTTNKNFDLTEWVVGDYSTETTIENPLQLEAREYIVLTGNQNFAAGIPNAIAISGFPSLNNNTPDDIYIRNKNGETIDSLRYYQSWGGNADGSSLERKDPLAASNDASNWQTNNSDNGISAGNQNISFQEDTDSPQMIFSKVLSNGKYEIRFNEFIRLTDNIAFYSGGERLSIFDFDSTNADVIFLSSSASKSNNMNANNTTIRVENLSDVKGNTTTSSEIPVAQPLQNGDLVINEIMFNPLANADDNQPDQTEYIELRNTQDYAISLKGLFLHDEPDENGNIRDIQPVSTTAKWVSPQGHVLIHADESTSFEESQTAVFFDLTSPNMQSIMRANRSSLSLASSDDAIYIADSTGTTIDSVFYDESWHNPNIIDTRGIALERIAPEGPSSDETNWGSSVTEKGGTPNSKNSIYQENGELSQETGISFNPNPFSPDDDGYEDNLFINYKLDQQDYLIKVRIYDRYGRLVRTLADGEQAGFEGQLIWDGRKDDNSRNRIGIYIVIFEAYDSASGSDETFKKTVVLARQLN
ncbi:lamin tail domain-containing protein [Fodinibius sp.]|uniref:lamin tail domain-containing protein n=1 Tax=Fodinibius sp. TaxID=1872440 RepID=UPI002ACDD301|nr:lamin tail domain-containing protein [Fodinibius sp.]MDZ7658602.1 lamin tail domain-containing protein [Fodinibius sp.]